MSLKLGKTLENSSAKSFKGLFRFCTLQVAERAREFLFYLFVAFGNVFKEISGIYFVKIVNENSPARLNS